jgi:hypothetical protein
VITFVIATVLMFGSVLVAVLWATAKDPRPRPTRRFALTYGKERNARDH